MNNGQDYSIQRATGAAEVSPMRTVANHKDGRKKDFGKRKRRGDAPGDDDSQDQADIEGVRVDLSRQEPASPQARADAPDEEDSTGSESVDCLV